MSQANSAAMHDLHSNISFGGGGDSDAACNSFVEGSATGLATLGAGLASKNQAVGIAAGVAAGTAAAYYSGAICAAPGQWMDSVVQSEINRIENQIGQSTWNDNGNNPFW
jgi:hypothetical protein